MADSFPMVYICAVRQQAPEDPRFDLDWPTCPSCGADMMIGYPRCATCALTDRQVNTWALHNFDAVAREQALYSQQIVEPSTPEDPGF